MSRGLGDVYKRQHKDNVRSSAVGKQLKRKKSNSQAQLHLPALDLFWVTLQCLQLKAETVKRLTVTVKVAASCGQTVSVTEPEDKD